MPDPAVTTDGVREILSLPERQGLDLGPHALAGARRLKQLIGTTNYTDLLGDDLDEDEQFAALLAGKLLGAASYLRTLQPAATNRGVSMTITRQDGGTETFAGAEQVRDMAKGLRERAIQELKAAGLYQRPAVSSVTRVDVDEEDA
jgi:hypothetical protein